MKSKQLLRTLTAEEYQLYSKKANLLEAYRQGGLTYFNKKYMDEKKYKLFNTSQWDMSDIDNMWLPNVYYDGHDNYWELMTQNALVQDYNLSIRGGTGSNSYYASVNYKDQDGIVKGSDSRFIAARFNFESKVSRNLKFGLNMDASSRQANNKDGMIDQIINMI